MDSHWWGIGLGRTGTNSICEAFRILGCRNVIHNPTFQQLRSAGGGADNGVTIYYKYLDYKFPNSKFVLTTREVLNWLSSMEFISGVSVVRSREADEMIKRRMLLYETVTFDKSKFLRAYFRHHEDVRSYFRSRPQDLLEMDIAAGDGWEKLCAFLGCPKPEVAFPHQHRRGEERARFPRSPA
jgi:hypothetical protein